MASELGIRTARLPLSDHVDMGGARKVTPKPETRIQKSETRNQKPESNPKPEARDPKPENPRLDQECLVRVSCF